MLDTNANLLIPLWHSNLLLLLRTTGCLKIKYPLLGRNRDEAIRCHKSMSAQLNLSVFNLNTRTLHFEIVHQTTSIRVHKVRILNALATRGFANGPSHYLDKQECCKRIFNCNFSFFTLERIIP